MCCVVWPNQTPIGTASNFLQCKWVSCGKSYWQGYDLGWYGVHQGRGQLLSAQQLRVGITEPFIPLRAESVAGFVGAPSVVSVVFVPSCAVLPSCRLRRLARWCKMVQMVSAAKQPRCTTAMFHSNQPETFPLSAGVSRPYLPPAPNKATETFIFFFGKMFAAASSSSTKQHKEAGKQQASSSRQAAAGKQQEASSSRQAAGGKQQAGKQASSKQASSKQASRQAGKQASRQAASRQAASRQAASKQAVKQQQASIKHQASSKQAASIQQPAFAPLNHYKKMKLFQAHGPKTMKSFSC